MFGVAIASALVFGVFALGVAFVGLGESSCSAPATVSGVGLGRADRFFGTLFTALCLPVSLVRTMLARQCDGLGCFVLRLVRPSNGGFVTSGGGNAQAMVFEEA